MLNHLNTLIGVDKETFLSRLELMYKKNTRLLKLIEIMKLEWGCPPLDEYMNTSQIIEHLKSIKINTKKINNMAKTNNKTESKFKNEIESTETEFLKFFTDFNEAGDSIEGKFLGSKDIDFKDGKGAQKIFSIETKDGSFNLPTNSELIKKLTTVENMNIPDIEVYIEYTGTEKLDKGKTVKKFKVLTDK